MIRHPDVYTRTSPHALPAPNEHLPADAALRALGAAPDPEPSVAYSVNIDGDTHHVHSNRAPDEVAERIRQKAYLKACERAYEKGQPLPPAPVVANDLDSARGMRSLAGRAHTDPGAPLIPSPSHWGASTGMPAHHIPVTPYPSAQPIHAPWQHVHANPQGQPPRISDRVTPFLEYIAQKQYSRQMEGDYQLSIRIFSEVVGNKYLHLLNHDDADALVKTLGSWPASASIKREFRLMKAPEIVRKAKLLRSPTLCLKTQQRHLDRLRSFLRWCAKRNEVRPDLLDGVRLFRKDQDVPLQKKSFDVRDLERIFSTNADKCADSPFMYWAPRLAFYQGMRVNEIAQLYIIDIDTIDGIPVIQVTRDRAGQRLKNKYSRRSLPIHQELLDLGFLDFVEQSRSFGRETLFPNVSWGANGPGDTVGDWFNNAFLRKVCDIADDRKTFHSFRHTFATLAERSGVKDAAIMSLLGHSPGKSMLRQHYVDPPTVAEHREAMEAIRFPAFNHPPYNAERFAPAFEKDRQVKRRKRLLEAAYGPTRVLGQF